MPIDVPSVLAASGIVTAALGALLIYTWKQSRTECLLWWGSAHLLVAAGTTLPIAARDLADEFSDLANAAVLIGYGLIWAGVRSFERKPTSLAIAVSGGVAWLVAAQFPVFGTTPSLRAALSFFISGSFLTATALTLAAGRSERLASRNVAMFLFSIHSVILIGRVPESLFGHWLPDGVISRAQLLAAFSLETLLFVVAAAFILLAMVRERSEGEQRERALTDPLTSVPNRRAFFERGETLLKDGKNRGVPTAVVLFDLDHFKQINDVHGHGSGDLALKSFAAMAASEVRTRDIFARIGGEEFACLMPGLSSQDAASTAERIRMAIMASEISGPDATFTLTVSAGVYVSSDSGMALDGMLAGADRALYEAKRQGRNRVVQGKPDLICQDGEQLGTTSGRAGSVVRAHRGAA